jgi:hypothetical protein
MFFKRSTLLLLTILVAACRPAATATPLPPTQAQPPSPAAEASPSPSPVPAAPTGTFAPAPLAFTEQFDGDLPYWTFQQIDNGEPAAVPGTEGGFLVFDLMGRDQWFYALYRVPAYTDIRVDAQVEVRAGGTGAFGIVCRYAEQQGWFEFNIYADQTYELLFGQWLSPGLARYTPLFSGESEKIKADANEIGLLCQGNTLTPFINGTQMRRWQDTRVGLKQGQVGISVASFESVPFTIAYDWLKVSEP